MNEEDNITDYLQRVDDVVNAIKAYGVDFKEDVLKFLRSMTTKYDAKISAIEEGREIDKITLDEVHGIITTYEMRIQSDKSSKREAAFKIVKKDKDESNKK